MNRSWDSMCVGLLLAASVLLAGCSRGGDDDVPGDNKEDVAALRSLGAKLEFNDSGHIRKVKLSNPATAEADRALPDGANPQAGIRDEDLKHLEGLPGLTELVLWRTRITDEGLAHLAKLKNLETLDLMHTRITDNGLQHLSGLERLKSLDLTGTRVTDDGVETLAKLGRLESLYLSGTLITKQGYEKLAIALPDTDIYKR
jgi:hypothetical protein